MVACSFCSNAGAICTVGRDSSRCSRCVEKNLRCDGTFSVEEFDKISEQRRRLQVTVNESKRRSAELMAQLAAELTRQSTSSLRLRAQLKALSSRQDSMLRREVQALEELDALESAEAAVSGVEPSWEDPAMLALMRDFVDTSGGASG
jgi:hypothetical protein